MYHVKLTDAKYDTVQGIRREEGHDVVDVTLELTFSCSPQLLDKKINEKFTEYIITWLDRWGRPAPEIMDILLERARDEAEAE